MREYTVSMVVETDIDNEGDVERVLRAALDNIAEAPYLDYSGLTVELEGDDQDEDEPAAIAGPEHDFSLNDQGTILVLTALTDEARAWVEENVSKEGYQPDLPNRVYLEHRFVDAILDGLDGDGFTVDAIERALAGERR